MRPLPLPFWLGLGAILVSPEARLHAQVPAADSTLIVRTTQALLDAVTSDDSAPGPLGGYRPAAGSWRHRQRLSQGGRGRLHPGPGPACASRSWGYLLHVVSLPPSIGPSMRTTTLAAFLLVLVACAKRDQQVAQDSPAAPLGAGAPSATLSLSALAGKWAVKTTKAGSDSVLLTFELNATADQAGWTFTFPNRPPVPVRVIAVEGDSVVTEAGPYESALRKGVQVSTRSVMRLENGELVGNTTAHYTTTGPDSVIDLRTRGTRQ